MAASVSVQRRGSAYLFEEEMEHDDTVGSSNASHEWN